MSRFAATLVLALSLASAACGSSIDLQKSLEVTDVFSGYYDGGIVDGKLNKLVPSVSFRLKNVGPEPVTYVQLMVSFWVVGDDGEWTSKDVPGIGAEELVTGASGEPILVRAEKGYTIEQPRAELFTHHLFKDVVVKLFGRRDGKIVPLGEFPIERRIIPQTTASLQ